MQDKPPLSPYKGEGRKRKTKRAPIGALF